MATLSYLPSVDRDTSANTLHLSDWVYERVCRAAHESQLSPTEWMERAIRVRATLETEQALSIH